MPTALILGASRGIGREYVQQLLASHWKVYATARDENSLEELRGTGAEALKLDLTIPESIAGLGWQLDDVKLDLAVYVAGVYGPDSGAETPPTVSDFDRVMHANVLGAMQVMPLVAPLVEAVNGKFIFISSTMGSIAEAASSNGWIYRTSKAALNMAVKSAAASYPKATLVAMCPGWVRTDMGGENASLSVEESVSGMLRVIGELEPADTGTFRNHARHHMSW